jgi:hypothetical protein
MVHLSRTPQLLLKFGGQDLIWSHLIEKQPSDSFTPETHRKRTDRPTGLPAILCQSFDLTARSYRAAANYSVGKDQIVWLNGPQTQDQDRHTFHYRVSRPCVLRSHDFVFFFVIVRALGAQLVIHGTLCQLG